MVSVASVATVAGFVPCTGIYYIWFIYLCTVAWRKAKLDHGMLPIFRRQTDYACSAFRLQICGRIFKKRYILRYIHFWFFILCLKSVI